MSGDDAPALQVRGLHKRYGGVVALREVSFDVTAGELVALVGPNGSGKSTAVDCITGFTTPTSGRILVNGRRPRAPQRLAWQGVARTFQSVRVFQSLSVRDNVLLGSFANSRNPVAAYLAHPGSSTRRRAGQIIAEFQLAHVAHMRAGEVSYGQRKLVEFAAAVMRNPSTLLLDEPVAAVNPTLAKVMRENILRFNEMGMSILLIEHNMEFVVQTCPRVIVLDQGTVLADGPAAEVMGRDDVREAYFGRV
jgi:branched-chain amino acid transport system ATP-binding protein